MRCRGRVEGRVRDGSARRRRRRGALRASARWWLHVFWRLRSWRHSPPSAVGPSTIPPSPRPRSRLGGAQARLGGAEPPRSTSATTKALRNRLRPCRPLLLRAPRGIEARCWLTGEVDRAIAPGARLAEPDPSWCSARVVRLPPRHALVSSRTLPARQRPAHDSWAGRRRRARPAMTGPRQRPRTGGAPPGPRGSRVANATRRRGLMAGAEQPPAPALAADFLLPTAREARYDGLRGGGRGADAS
jgi:hypothetical protein